MIRLGPSIPSPIIYLIALIEVENIMDKSVLRL